MKYLLDYERDYGVIDVSHVRWCYNDDMRNRRIRPQSFESYLATSIEGTYGVSRYVALRFARQLYY